MSSSDFITILAAVSVGLVTAVTGVAAYLSNRRGARGQVATSEAAVLWQQSQDMRAMLLTEKEKAEEQRDRLIAAYTEQVLPMLTGITALCQDLSLAVTECVALVREVREAVEGGGREAAAVVPASDAESG